MKIHFQIFTDVSPGLGFYRAILTDEFVLF